MLLMIVCYLFVLPYFDQLQMGTDMNLDDLSCTLDYTAEGSCLSVFFFCGIPAKYTKVYPTYKYMQTYILTCPSESFSVQTVT